jgi:predicted RNA-binding Zn-ribbon protein involved in translation (DUF1610 family)
VAAEADVTDRCSGCGRELEPARVRSVGDVERFSCLGCGLQLVRRKGEGWNEIRG